MRFGLKDGWPENIRTLEDAKKERGRILGKIDARMTEAAARIEWQNRYSDFDKLSEEYEKWIKDRLSRATVESYLSNVKNYVFYFFIKQQGMNNIETWPTGFKEFRKFLLETNALKISKKLSTNSRNNCIKSLNSFLKFMEVEHNKGPFVRCAEFQTGKSDRRGLDDIYSEIDKAKLIDGAAVHGELYSLFFNLLSLTGMRTNEALGLHVGSFTFGDIPEAKKNLFRRIHEAGIPIFGYILLKDQPEFDQIFIEGKVPRAPLKSRKEISPEYNRYIPLIDESMSVALANLISLREKNKSVLKEDNLIFGFTYAQMYNIFCSVKAEVKLKPNKDIHSLRHTFATWLTKKCQGDKTVSAEVLGQSERIAERYVHLAEELEQQRSQIPQSREVKKVVF